MKRFIPLFLLFAVSACAPARKEPAETTTEKAPAKALSIKEPAEILSGKVVLTDGIVSVDSLGWNPHASFKGVSLKHIIVGANTGGEVSCHIVRIEPNCELATHTHPTQIELHQVLSGSGTFVLDAREAEYVPGTSAVIPAGTPHSVLAGPDGLYILATFTPSLL